MSDSLEEGAVENIAIIGLAGRFPGARNVAELWGNLRNGADSIHRFTDQELLSLGIDSALLNNPNYVKAKGLLEGTDLFDAAFFGYSPREAELMDPQQRIFLESAWEALEDAGYTAEAYSDPIAVFAGAGANDYIFNLASAAEAEDVGYAYQLMIGNEKDFLATRVSYKLDLKGPSLNVQTGCSTSLVAVHLACQSLLSYQCSMALAGGVCVLLRQKGGYFYQEGGIPSPDGYCRAFDTKARGTVVSEGVGIVVLKRLSDALADRDHIYAVIKGSAINNDGSSKMGFTAPSVEGQAQVIAMAQALADVSAESIDYIEAHGTGTPLGDTIEIAALSQVFRAGTSRKGFCAIGSIKANIGHLDAAAGVAGLIKTALALEHKEIPPSIHVEQPNPKIDFDNSPFYVNTELSDWHKNAAPRRAGVSSFGLGGTNAHVVIEEAPDARAHEKSRPVQLLLFSARTNPALDKMTANFVQHLKQYPDSSLADAAYTLHVGRKAFSHRRMVVCRSSEDAIVALQTQDSGRFFLPHQEPQKRDVVFMFSGQGAQYANMGLEIYRTEPEFKKHIDYCSEILVPILGLDLRYIIYPDEENIEKADKKLAQTYITQPALFAIEYALAKLWISWGINPSALVGHSIGEYSAACLAGVFSLEDGLTLVATRGRLIQELPGGSMLAVSLSEEDIRPLLSKRLSLAVINAPSVCAVSGDSDAVEELEKKLTEKHVACRRLHTSHAFHSQMMDSVLEAFVEQAKRVSMRAPRIPFLSNVTGTWITAEEAESPAYWARHLRQTVRFSDCANELFVDPSRVLLEVGPGSTLSTLVRRNSSKPEEQVVLNSIRHPKEEKSDVAFMLEVFGRLWLAGVQVDWSGFHKPELRHRIPLPTYPFERYRYWIEPAILQTGPSASQTRLIGLGKNFQNSTQGELSTDFPTYRDPNLKSGYAAPRNRVEHTLANIWKTMLGLNRIGINDNYFDLGGDSLLATSIFQQIEKIFGKNLAREERSIPLKLVLKKLLNSMTIMSFMYQFQWINFLSC